MPYLLDTKGNPLIPVKAALYLAGGDIAALFLAQIAAGHLTDWLIGFTPPYERYYIYTIVAALLMLSFISLDHYTRRIPWWNQVRALALLIAGAGMAEIVFASVSDIQDNLLLVSLNWIIALVLIMASRITIYKKQKKRPDWGIPTVIVAQPNSALDMLYAFKTELCTSYAVHSIFLRDGTKADFAADEVPPQYKTLSLHEQEDPIDYIARNPDNFYIIALDTFKGDERDRLVSALDNATIHYAIVPPSGSISLYQRDPTYFFGFDVMLMQPRLKYYHPIPLFIKRVLDIVIAFCAMLGLSPFFIGVMAAMKLEGHKDELFYGGMRLGKNGKLFKCWKFKTMASNSDHLLEKYLEENPEAKAHWEKYFKLPNDPRVTTKTARILRKASLDELPQLWNVLKGDMSIVGPRPILPTEKESYGASIEEYMLFKPGITGLWQVSGRNAVSFQRRIYWDSWYVRNWSLWGDIVIILKTLPAVIKRGDAF